ncbi:MAG: DUF616 domain-containing protein [Devosia sp.]
MHQITEPIAFSSEAVFPLFDRAYYLSRNSDVRDAGIDPLSHFMMHGFDENRDPHPAVDLLYCRFLAEALGQPLQTADDLADRLAAIAPDAFWSASPLVTPKWLLSSLSRPFLSLADALSSPLKEGVMLHPALLPIQPGRNLRTIADAVAALRSGLVATACRIDLQRYVNEHRDLRKVGYTAYDAFRHAFTSGLAQNRFKYLGARCDPRRQLHENFLDAADKILRSKANQRFFGPAERVPNLTLAERLTLVTRGKGDPAAVFAATPEAVTATALGTAGHGASRKRPLLGGSRLDGSDTGGVNTAATDRGASTSSGSETGPLLPKADDLILTQRGIDIAAVAIRPTRAPPAHHAPLTDRALLAGHRPDPKAVRVVYSAVIGGYEPALPVPPEDMTDAIAILITDMPQIPPDTPWIIVRPTFCEQDLKRLCLWYKTHPHALFPFAETAVWIDGNVTCHPGSAHLLAAQETVAEVATFMHPDRQCIYDEAEAVKSLQLDFPHVVDEMVERLKTLGMPANYGLFETNVLLTRSSDLAVRAMLDTWWNEIARGSRRDQLSFTLAAWRSGVVPTPLEGGRSAHGSRFFSKRRHDNPKGRCLGNP